MFEVETIRVGYLEANCYLLYDPSSKDAFIIDPGGDAPDIEEKIDDLALKPAGIINTHGHYDHIASDNALRTIYEVPLYIHKDDKEFLGDSTLNGSSFFGENKKIQPPYVLLEEGASIAKGSINLKILHTPGHTPGGICLVTDKIIFTGDTLFKGSVGRWDLPGGNEIKLRISLEKFRGLPKDMRIFPGHGEESTIGEELRNNPYLV